MGSMQVVIIGGGISGIATAIRLRELGTRVDVTVSLRLGTRSSFSMQERPWAAG